MCKFVYYVHFVQCLYCYNVCNFVILGSFCFIIRYLLADCLCFASLAATPIKFSHCSYIFSVTVLLVAMSGFLNSLTMNDSSHQKTSIADTDHSVPSGMFTCVYYFWKKCEQVCWVTFPGFMNITSLCEFCEKDFPCHQSCSPPICPICSRSFFLKSWILRLVCPFQGFMNFW